MRGDDKVGYYHVCTNGNAIEWMFQDDEDFIAGVNRIGLCVLMSSVEVVAFILMDNHVHFVLYGTAVQCKAFINIYKRLTGRWISNKYGLSDYLRLLPTEMIRIDDEECLMNTIAYIDRNPIVAGYKFMPCEYPWGTARYMFRDKAYESVKNVKYAKVGNMTSEQQRSVLKTRIRVPVDWLVSQNGMILPGSFMDLGHVERIFKTPARYSYFLAKKLEGLVEVQMLESRKTFMPDKDLRKVTKQISRKMYGVDDVRSLDVNSRLAIARKLRYDYASTVKQISRMLYLDPDVLGGFV